MSGIATKVRTALALGPRSIARVAFYRLAIMSGVNPVRRLAGDIAKGPFYRACDLPAPASAITGWKQNALYFGWFEKPLDDLPPNWHENPFFPGHPADARADWWAIPDFDLARGDIKGIWEASRFDWILAFAQQARAGEPEALHRLNDWLTDWSVKNPPYKGPNWKCGQETSIRLMHLAMGSLILGQAGSPEAGLADLVRLHLRRIAPTLGYALGQNNNHGTSEAAALFIGGSWLASLGDDEGGRWSAAGRKCLEERARALIESDGTFSQYSVNYHRMMLDTYSMVEIWRRNMGLTPFSTELVSRLSSAVNWLRSMVNEKTGDAPNLGHNDGSRLLVLTQTDYRDFRPSVQMASALFDEALVYQQQGHFNDGLKWLGVALPARPAKPGTSNLFDKGGFAVLRKGEDLAVIRYPRFRFRPAQADALHVDLWIGARNVLQDAGSYNYADMAAHVYFTGTGAHNTVQFDERDQMPRIGRFLFGDWLMTSTAGPIRADSVGDSFEAGYRDRQGASHVRRISLGAKSFIVEDRVCGFKKKAVLRWRLQPGVWKLEDNKAVCGEESIRIHATSRILRTEIVPSKQSRYYMQTADVPVLEVEIAGAGAITTTYEWAV
jgi:Heparinase II/III-like protein